MRRSRVRAAVPGISRLTPVVSRLIPTIVPIAHAAVDGHRIAIREIAQPFLILLGTAVLVLIVAVRQYRKRAG